MTDRNWTIVNSITQEVVEPSFPTSDENLHPKDCGFDWDEAIHRAIRIPRAPDPARHKWDGTAWVDDLDQLRARRWGEIKVVRDAVQNGGCQTLLGRVDTDPDSQRKVSGSVQLAMIAGDQFSVAWTMQDNEVKIHDAAAMIAMGVAVGQHVAACHAVAQAKRAELDAATTSAELAAVDIESGWPN